MSDVDRVPDVMVELLLLGELEPDEAADVRARLEADDDPRIAEIERSNEALLARFPVDEVVPELRAALEATADEPSSEAEPAEPVEPNGVVSLNARRPKAMVWGSALVAVAAGLVLAWGLRDAAPVATEDPATRISMTQIPAPSSDGVRNKGAQRLIVFREGNDQALHAGDGVSAGDVLQLAYATAGERHGVIVSLDGAGVVTLHWPADAGNSTELGSGVVRLDYAYELDDAPDFERFVFVASDQPLVVDDVMTAAQDVASGSDPEHATLRGPDAWHQVSVGLTKTAAHP